MYYNWNCYYHWFIDITLEPEVVLVILVGVDVDVLSDVDDPPFLSLDSASGETDLISWYLLPILGWGTLGISIVNIWRSCDEILLALFCTYNQKNGYFY